MVQLKGVGSSAMVIPPKSRIVPPRWTSYPGSPGCCGSAMPGFSIVTVMRMHYKSSIVTDGHQIPGWSVINGEIWQVYEPLIAFA